MSAQKEVPILRGEELYIPFVGAIIETEINQKKQILIQIRQKASDKSYSGLIEIPGGKMQAYEDVYETVAREVKEESGLEITLIEGRSKRIDYQNKTDTSSLIEPFCVTQMQNGPFIGLIFLCKAIGEPAVATEEARDAQWIDVEDLRRIVNESPERIYTAFLAPLKKYLELRKE
jgi:8-oxo-dGTP pyrophosphatase MutT (NUDIX family)